MFPALEAALRSLGGQKALSYYDVVLAGLPEAARGPQTAQRWEV
jgi:hypothetical protein